MLFFRWQKTKDDTKKHAPYFSKKKKDWALPNPTRGPTTNRSPHNTVYSLAPSATTVIPGRFFRKIHVTGTNFCDVLSLSPYFFSFATMSSDSVAPVVPQAPAASSQASASSQTFASSQASTPPSPKRRKIVSDAEKEESVGDNVISSGDPTVATDPVPVAATPPDSEVVVHITHPYILRQFVEVISNLLSDVDFQIVSTPSFTGLEVATVNETKTCMIQARLTNPIVSKTQHHKLSLNSSQEDDGLTNFCVSVNTLLKCLEVADQDQTVVLGIEKHVVHFEAFQPNLNGARLNIPIKVSEQDIWLLEQQEFKYTMKFKQAFFRKHVKMLSRLQVNKVDFCLYRPRKNKGFGEKITGGEDATATTSEYPDDDVQNLYFAFRGESDDVNDMCIWFHSSTKQQQYTSAANIDDPTASAHSPISSPSSSVSSDKEHRLVGHTYITVEGDNGGGRVVESTDDGLVANSGDNITRGRRNELSNSIPDWDSMEELYRERFLTRYLEYFTKNIDRNDITFYMAPNAPLVLHFPVGDTSYIRFVLMMCDKSC